MNAPQLDTAWTELCDALQRSSSRILEETPQLQAEGYRYLARFLAAGLKSCVTHDDPNEPILHSMIDESAPWGLDHPDCHYLYGALQPNANYRLVGDLGTANVLDVQINSGHFSCGSVQGVDTLRAFSRDQLNADPNGAVPDIVEAVGQRHRACLARACGGSEDEAAVLLQVRQELVFDLAHG